MQSNDLDAEYLQKSNILSAVTRTEAGVAFLQWLVRLTGFNKPSMSMEDAARRDVWLSVRRFIDIQKLSEIEHFDIRCEQELVRKLLQDVPADDRVMEGILDE